MRFFLFAFTALAAFSGCGYTLQNSHSPLADKEGIRRVYVEPLANNTYKPGAENVVYNAILRALSVHRRVVLVTSKESADAVLHGSVANASYTADASKPPQAGPNGAPPPGMPANIFSENVLLATEYVATLTCNFSLERINPGPGQRRIVWTSGFTRTEPFGASNQYGAAGSTSSLINESEFDRALQDMASRMSSDMHESMLAMF